MLSGGGPPASLSARVQPAVCAPGGHSSCLDNLSREVRVQEGPRMGTRAQEQAR